MHITGEDIRIGNTKIKPKKNLILLFSKMAGEKSIKAFGVFPSFNLIDESYHEIDSFYIFETINRKDSLSISQMSNEEKSKTESILHKYLKTSENIEFFNNLGKIELPEGNIMFFSKDVFQEFNRLIDALKQIKMMSGSGYILKFNHYDVLVFKLSDKIGYSIKIPAFNIKLKTTNLDLLYDFSFR